MSSAWRRLRRLAIVGLITVLVWVWADLEHGKTERLTVRVKVVAPPDSNLLVISPDPEGVPIVFYLRGLQGKLRGFFSQFQDDQARGRDIACVVQADSAWEPGQYRLDTLEVVNKWDRLRRAGLSGENPSPGTIPVNVDRWAQIEATVELRTSNDAALAGKTVISPKKVTISVPSRRVGDLGDNPVIKTEQLPLEDLIPGENVTRTVQLASGIDGVRVEPVSHTQVTVTLRIRQQTPGETKLRVNVQLLALPDIWQQIAQAGYVLEREDPSPLGPWNPELIIAGPRKEIDKLTADDVTAFVQITEAELKPVGTRPKGDVTVILPPGLELVAPAELAVRFRFVRAAPTSE